MGIKNSDTNNVNDQLSYVNTSVALTAGGTAMDLTQMVISYSDNNKGRNPSIANTTDLTCGELTSTGLGTTVTDMDDIEWCVSQKINDLNPGAENNLLESNEIWVLSIQTPNTATVNTKITFNLQPAVGAVLPISRTLPGGLNAVQAIY
jgi:flagellin FlaB